MTRLRFRQDGDCIITTRTFRLANGKVVFGKIDSAKVVYIEDINSGEIVYSGGSRKANPKNIVKDMLTELGVDFNSETRLRIARP